MNARMDAAFAKVKFIDDQSKRIIPVNTIVEFQKNPPTSLQDFDKNKIYECWYTDDKNPDLEKYPIQIADLCDETEALLESKRPIFSKLSNTIIDEYYNDDVDTAEHNLKLQKKKRQKNIKETEKAEQLKLFKTKMDKFCILNKKDVISSETTDTSTSILSTDLQKKEICSNDCKPVDENKILNENKFLKEENKTLIEKNKALKQEVNVCLSKYERLKAQYIEQGDRLETLKILNEKLQGIIYLNKSNKEGSPLTERKRQICHSTPKKLVEIDDFTEKVLKNHSPIDVNNITDSYIHENQQNISFEEGEKEKEEIDLSLEKVQPIKKAKLQNNDTEIGCERKFLEKYRNDIHGTKYIYLQNNLNMLYDEWKKIMASKTESMFTKRLLRYFYNEDELTKRCVKEGETTKTPGGVHRRKVISPKKSDTIKKCLEYFIRKNSDLKSDNDVKNRLNKMNHYISEEINKNLKIKKKLFI